MTLTPEDRRAALIADLNSIADEIFDRWDKDMRSGKLLTALAGRITGYDPRVDRIRAALADALPAPTFGQSSQGEGWKLVPIEPTSEMMEAGLAQWSNLRDMYEAMLAVAPLPAVAEGE